MKLYATTTSERASKGQGGNEYIETWYQNEKKERLYCSIYTTNGLVLYRVHPEGLAPIFMAKNENGATLDDIAREAEEWEKGERQKGKSA